MDVSTVPTTSYKDVLGIQRHRLDMTSGVLDCFFFFFFVMTIVFKILKSWELKTPPKKVFFRVMVVVLTNVPSFL